jgi:hypothetical protein
MYFLCIGCATRPCGELAMKTVIADDRINRFAELDHTVVEEVRVIMEACTAEPPAAGTSAIRGRRLARLYTTLLASIRLSSPS